MNWSSATRTRGAACGQLRKLLALGDAIPDLGKGIVARLLE
jgi:hypothetical protein